MVAIDAGTTGVRALVVDERAQVVDVAYRELTQYFPRPGWVEHDATEIWEAVCATLAEVGGRLADAGRAVAAIGITNQRETLVAFDRSNGQPLHRAIVWQDRRTADICAELEGAGHLPMVRERTGLMLDPYFTATKITWLLRHGALALGPESADLAFGTVDSWLLWNLTGGTQGGEFATDPSNASRTMLLDTATLAWSDDLCALFGVPLHTLPEVRPSAGRFGTTRLADLGPAGAVLDGLPISGVLGDQQAALFGQCCFDPGMVKVTYGTGSFVLANAGPVRPAAPDGLTVSVAWDLGPHAGGVRVADDRDRRVSAPVGAGAAVAYALEGSTFVSGAAIQWLRDGLGIIADAAEAGPLAESVGDSGGVTFVPGPDRARQPVVGSGGARHHHRAHPGRRKGPDRPGLHRGHRLPGARHDRCHGGRLGLPPVLPAGRRGCGRHGPAPATPGRAEQDARRPPTVDRVHRPRRRHPGRPGRRGVGVARRS